MIARKSILIIISKIISNALSFIALFFVAHYMGPEPLGIIGFATSFVGLFNFAGDLGFGIAHIKRVSEGKDVERCIGTYLSIKLILTATTVIIIFGAISVSKFVLHNELLNPEIELVVYIALVGMVLANITQVILNTFTAKKETAKQEFSQLIGKFVSAPTKIVVALASLGVVALAFTGVLGGLVTLAVAILLFRGFSIKKPKKEYFKSYSKFAIPLMLVIAVTVVATNINKVMIQFFWGAEEVGYYYCSERIIGFLLVGMVSVEMLFFPSVSSYHAEGNFIAIRRLVHITERYISMLLFPTTTLIIIFTEPIVCLLLGDKFLPAVPIVQLTCIYVLSYSLALPYGRGLLGIDRPEVPARIVIFGMVLLIFLNILLIPKHFLGLRLLGLGAVGAAIAVVLSTLFIAIMYEIRFSQLTGISPSPRLLLHVLATSIMGIILYIFNMTFPAILWYYLVAYGLIGIGIYLGILYILKEFKREDIRFFLNAVDPIQMKRYIMSEMKKK